MYIFKKALEEGSKKVFLCAGVLLGFTTAEILYAKKKKGVKK